MDDIRVPIYLVTGFLESGKTTFLDFTLQQEYFAIDGKTLLILCEEGEEEYDMDKLKLTNTVVEVIEDEEDLTPQRLAAMDIIHQPERVVIEYNGMWLVSKFEQMELPEGWEKAHKLVVYAMENGQKNVWFRIPVRELKRKQKTPQFYLDQEVIDAKTGRIHLSGWTVSRGPVKIALFDREKKKISLGYRKAEDNPWIKFISNYGIGDVVPVKVLKFMPFGAFAEVIPGVDGLIHISQISNQRINKPDDVLSENEIVNAKITDIDTERQKISLSIRAVIEDGEEENRVMADEPQSETVYVSDEE